MIINFLKCKFLKLFNLNMKEYKIKHIDIENLQVNFYTVYKNNNIVENKYRKDLSNKIINRFGKQHNTKETLEIFEFSKEYFIKNFVELCHTMNDVWFYRTIMGLHEQSLSIAWYSEDCEFPKEVNMSYIALYRRILKLILEEATLIDLIETTPKDLNYIQANYLPILNELIFLGDFAYSCQELLSEQYLMDNIATVEFDENNQYIFTRHESYNALLSHIQEKHGIHQFKHGVDLKKELSDLHEALEKCINLSSFKNNFIDAIGFIHKKLSPKYPELGQYTGFELNYLFELINKKTGVDLLIIEKVFSGIIINRSNKRDIREVIKKPYDILRYNFRPVAIWKVNNIDRAFIGHKSLAQSFIKLSTEAIPYNKIPKEWDIPCFRKYMNNKTDEHDSWLDNEVEKRIIELNHENIIYYKNQKHLKTNDGGFSLEVKDIGEVDFIIINKSLKRVFIIDCKNLRPGYDMTTLSHDRSKFEKDEKSYNTQLDKKVKWFQENKIKLQEHLKNESQINLNLLDFSVEGFFITTTYTMYMYYSNTYKIYPVNWFTGVITGNTLYPDIITVHINNTTTYQMTFPYFKNLGDL